MFDKSIDYSSLFKLLKDEIGIDRNHSKVSSLFTRKYKDRKIEKDTETFAYYGNGSYNDKKTINFDYQNKKCGIELLNYK